MQMLNLVVPTSDEETVGTKFPIISKGSSSPISEKQQAKKIKSANQ